ncbi:hypothetical protein AB0F71_18280 [Kitasatospora sp. NPDC028055]|uniref:hypothetical protein n=1 Tax=Kitasatospora sp. NPDC028055 TaxID=3155653 RepID=UPI00340AE551
MSVFLPLLVIVALATAEAAALRRHSERSVLLLLKKDRAALIVGAAWWVFATAVSVPGGSVLGGALFGFLSACIVGCTVATLRRARARTADRRRSP